MHDGRDGAGGPRPLLWQHPNGRWYVLYGPGLKRRVSCWTTSRDEAQVFLKDFELGRDAQNLSGETVADILRGYEDEKKTEVRAPETLKYSVAPLVEHLGRLQPEQLLRPVIRAYPAQRRKNPAKGRGVSDGTILREIGTLRAALEWAVECGLIASYPRISNPVKTPAPKDRWLTREEARALLAACVEPHLKAFVMLGLMTAARSGAILELPWSRILWDQGLIDYGDGHGNKRRAIVPMNEELRKFLKGYSELRCTDYVIERHGQAVASIRKGFDAACERAGVLDASPHTLRHTAATWMAQGAVPMREIARVLGDQEATTERVYAKYHPDYLRTATGALRLNMASLQESRPRPEEVLHL